MITNTTTVFFFLCCPKCQNSDCFLPLYEGLTQPYAYQGLASSYRTTTDTIPINNPSAVSQTSLRLTNCSASLRSKQVTSDLTSAASRCLDRQLLMFGGDTPTERSGAHCHMSTAGQPEDGGSRERPACAPERGGFAMTH